MGLSLAAFVVAFLCRGYHTRARQRLPTASRKVEGKSPTPQSFDHASALPTGAGSYLRHAPSLGIFNPCPTTGRPGHPTDLPRPSSVSTSLRLGHHAHVR